MIEKPSIPVLTLILDRFDKRKDYLCHVAHDLYFDRLLSNLQLYQCREYFRSLLGADMCLELWLFRRGLIAKTAVTPETMAHRRAWLVKMINGEIP